MTSVPSVAVGRGAFKATGKDNGKRYYQFVENAPLDGDQPLRDVNYRAVNLGVKAIQSRINAYGYSPALIVDGKFGQSTHNAAKWVQSRLGLYVDGIVGPATCRALWKDLLIWFGGVYHVPASQLYGFMMLESGGDPGAIGVTTPSDHGLNQINLVAHTNVTAEQACDPVFSIDYTAKRLGNARAKYSGKGVDLKNKVSVAQHNSPVAADIWYRDEKPPLGPVYYNGKWWDGWPNIENYVNLVMTEASKFKA